MVRSEQASQARAISEGSITVPIVAGFNPALRLRTKDIIEIEKVRSSVSAVFQAFVCVFISSLTLSFSDESLSSLSSRELVDHIASFNAAIKQLADYSSEVRLAVIIHSLSQLSEGVLAAVSHSAAASKAPSKAEQEQAQKESEEIASALRFVKGAA